MHANGAVNRPGSACGSLEAASQAFIATADEVVAIVGVAWGGIIIKALVGVVLVHAVRASQV